MERALKVLIVLVVAMGAIAYATGSLDFAPKADNPEPKTKAAAKAPPWFPTGETSEATVSINDAPELHVQVADTKKERSEGLMETTELAPDGGMLFAFKEPSSGSFYMYNTPLPLDIAFIQGSEIISIMTMKPCLIKDPSACPLYGPGVDYELAVETRAGFFAKHNVETGDAVKVSYSYE